MKNSEIIKNYNNLYGIIMKNEKYPVRFSFAITKNLKMLEGFVNDFEGERNKILARCCLKNADGSLKRKKNGDYHIADAHRKEWDADIKELLDIDVKIEPQMISAEDYPDNIEPAAIMALDFMTKE